MFVFFIGMRKRIYLSPPSMTGKEKKFVKEAFKSNWISPLGPQVDAFEQEICQVVGVNHGLATSSATTAIHLALLYLNVKAGDLVFCSDFTFSGSCNPILYLDAKPVFIDCEPESWNMSPTALKKAFEWAAKEKKLPKAVIVVDIYGQSADWDELIPICEHYGVPIIEDSAQSLGATYQGKPCGSFGLFGIFSFNGNKIVTTSGGGMVVSKDTKSIDKMRYWASQSKEPGESYLHREVGYNYQLSNISAAIGRGQLLSLSDFIASRKTIWFKYFDAFCSLPISTQPLTEKGESNYWLSSFLLDEDVSVKPRDIIQALKKENIEAKTLFRPMHLQPIFKNCPFFSSNGQDESIGEQLFSTGFSLPSSSHLLGSEQKKVIQTIQKVLS